MERHQHFSQHRNQKVVYFKTKEEEVKLQKAQIREQLEILTQWIGESFTYELLSSGSDPQEASQMPQFELTDRKGKLSAACE